LFWDALRIKAQLILQSETGVEGKGSDLIIDICRRLNSGTYLNFPVVKKYLDAERFNNAGINIKYLKFNPPVYPQLWGEFICNLSMLDMILTCGEKSREIICHSN
jgi:hypothetical protein